MEIFVIPSYQQQVGDVVLYSYDDIVALEVADASLYENYIVPMDSESIEEIEKEIANGYTKELNIICDQKSKGVKVIIAGMHVSQEQMEEYQMVADAIDREDVAWFEDEAQVLGTTAQEEFDKAKASKAQYEFAYNAFKKLIRVYRRFVVSKIKTREFTLVQEMLKDGRGIGVGLDGTPMEILTQSKEQVMQIILGKGDSDGTK